MDLMKALRLDSKKTMIAITLLLLTLFYSLFMLLPIAYALLGSFATWNPMIGQMDFAGLRNYERMLTSPIFHKAIINTLLFTFVVTTARVILGVLLAVFIDGLKFGKSFFRMTYFLPVVASLVAISLIWVWIYEPTSGILNQLLNLIGIESQGWLKSKNLALVSIMIATTWKDVGFAMVLYLAGLNNIPRSLYEAADVDGASRAKKFLNIQLPMLSSTTVLVSVTGIIGYIQMFDQVYMMTERAGPNNATITAVYLLYEEAFVSYRFGNAAVIAFVIFLLTFIFSLVQLKNEQTI